jgi:hypothetical protein
VSGWGADLARLARHVALGPAHVVLCVVCGAVLVRLVDLLPRGNLFSREGRATGAAAGHRCFPDPRRARREHTHAHTFAHPQRTHTHALTHTHVCKHTYTNTRTCTSLLGSAPVLLSYIPSRNSAVLTLFSCQNSRSSQHPRAGSAAAHRRAHRASSTARCTSHRPRSTDPDRETAAFQHRPS